MKGKDKGEVIAGISSAAVKAKTGKGWKGWLAILDKAGAKKMNHTQIAACLYAKLKVPGWWSQMVAVGYEQARGLREKHQTREGYQVSVSKTMACPVSKAYKFWADNKLRSKWLPKAPMTFTKANLNKSIRFIWENGKTRGEVNFYSKGKDKCQVVVQHSRLPDAKAGERMRGFWKKALERIKATTKK